MQMTSLRPATEADRAFCWQLHKRTLRPYVEATWGWDEADQQRRFDDAFNAHTRQVVEHDGLPAGMLQVDRSASPVRLLNIQVLPAMQRQGLGSTLIRAVLHEAGEVPVWLQVLKANPARNLYLRLGFRVIGETDTHWQMLHEPVA